MAATNLGFGGSMLPMQLPRQLAVAQQPGARPAGRPNVFGQAAGWLGQAGTTAGQVAGAKAPMLNDPKNIATAKLGDPTNINAAMVQAGQLSNTNLGAYQNPYTSQVIDRSMQDLDRARQMTMNQTGAQATAAGAFGGSRHGIAEAETNRAFADQAGNMAAGLRNQGYQQAVQGAQFDIGNRLNAGLANQNSTNTANQFNQGQAFQASQLNQAALNNTSQFNQNQAFQASMANQQAGLAGRGLNLQGAGMLGNLSNLGFGQGMAINQQQAQQGAQQQALMQQLINAGRGQWQGFTGQPGQSMNPLLGMLGGAGSFVGQTQSTSPGLLGGLGAILGSL